MPPIITNLSATTELEAVNAMLSAIGESPVATVDTANVNVEMAVNTLQHTTREVLRMGWRQNTEFGLAIAPAAQYSWTDPDGTVVPLNIFTLPTGLAKWTPSDTSAQLGLDVVVRPSKLYTPGTMVVYDRARNRDGLPASEFAKLYIDAVWYFDFEKLNEALRRYITVVAGRRFVTDVVGSADMIGFRLQDERMAFRNVKLDEGDVDDFNMLDHPDVSKFLGGRPRRTGRIVDLRSNP